MKHTNIISLILLMFLSYTSLNATPVKINELNYTLNDQDKSAQVAENSSITGDIEIPGQVTYNGITYDVTSIADFAFGYNIDITSVKLGNKLTKIGIHAFNQCNGITSLTIPDNVKTLGIGAFEECKGLTTLIVGNGITHLIGFRDCTSLTSITLPSGLKSIGFNAFANCSKLTEITIPDNVESIDDEAFEDCLALQTFNISKNLTSLGDLIFNHCNALKTINVDAENPAYSSIDGIVYNKAQTEIVIVPTGITGTINIPGTVKNITGIFADHRSLQGVVISEGTETIGANAFRDCEELATVTLPQGVKSLGNYAFKECKKLTSIQLPSSLTSIGYNVFSGCEMLLSINIPDGITQLNETFSLCYSLNKVEFGSGLTTIGYQTFYCCYDLETIVLPNTVTTIDKEAFSDCKGLNSITIGKNVATIADHAFSNCPNLKEIIILNPTPPTCGENLFYKTVPNLSKLYVAHGSVNAYKEAEVWKTFKKVIELYEDGKRPLTLSVSTEGNGTVLVNGTKVETSTTVKEGTDVTLTFKPSDGYILTNLMLDEEDLTDKIVKGEYTIKAINDHLSFSVEFKEGYTVNAINRDDLGTVTVNGKPAPLTIEKGQPVEFTVKPTTLYYIEKALLNNTEIQLGEGNTYKVNSIDKDLTFEVNYEEFRTIVAQYDEKMGSVMINDKDVLQIEVKKGEQVKFTITPKPGYTIKEAWIGNNEKNVTDEIKDGIYVLTTGDATSYVLNITFEKGSSIATTGNDQLTIYTREGKLFIENAPESVSITDSKGQTVYQGSEKEITLPSGLYIIRSGEKTVKTLVK